MYLSSSSETNVLFVTPEEFCRFNLNYLGDECYKWRQIDQKTKPNKYKQKNNPQLISSTDSFCQLQDPEIHY